MHELQEIIDDLTEQYTSVHKLLDDKSGSKNFKHMVKRKHCKLVMEKRIGMRKSGTGRPRAMDETDENYVLQCIENKATAHGRRHDSVMYLNHRVKKKDFLRLANTSRISRGLKPIKSSTTVFNPARPRNRRSLQAKKHLGLGLFCSKKPPKLEDNENILTHHQRAFKKAILMARCGEDDEEKMKYNLFISRDDKAYICPGTGTGMQSARNVKIIQPSDPSKQRVLPKYDFPERLVNATPGVNRIMNYEINKEMGSKDQLKMTDTEVAEFNRPKNFVGSNGSVWASEYMRLRYEEPVLFVVDESELKSSTSSLTKLVDQLKLYCLMSNKSDVLNISPNLSCAHRQYEILRATSLVRILTSFQDTVEEEPNNYLDVDMNTLAELVNSSTELLGKLQSDCHHSVIWNAMEALLKSCRQNVTNLAECLPEFKSRIHEFTDAGPGVGITNNDVKVRCAEIILLTGIDYYIRHHLANGDSSQNEVERCQSYVGDAICDGGALIWEYKSSYEGLTEEQISAMSFDELEKGEHDRMKYNAFKVCEELTYRIDGATAPGGFMKAYTSQDSDDLFFNNHDHLKAFLSTTDIKGNKKQCPGWNYFTMLKTFFDQHVEVGEKYMEYVKCTCEHCQICATNTWVGPPCCKVPKPYPDYTSDGFW